MELLYHEVERRGPRSKRALGYLLIFYALKGDKERAQQVKDEIAFHGLESRALRTESIDNFVKGHVLMGSKYLADEVLDVMDGQRVGRDPHLLRSLFTFYSAIRREEDAEIFMKRYERVTGKTPAA